LLFPDALDLRGKLNEVLVQAEGEATAYLIALLLSR
jgi:hypothetical protein